MKIVLTILIFLFCLNANAHQPKLINYSPTLEDPHNVINPEISKAYYGKLTGSPHYYIINSDKSFSFYTGITSPKKNESLMWFSLEVIDENNQMIFFEDGEDFDWKAWYEPYARDWYWLGPQIGSHNNSEFKSSLKLNAGSYIIKVFNKNNLGSYSLAVGDKEFFGSNLFEKIITWVPILFYIGPYMDIVHWNKFDIFAYVPHIILIIIIITLSFMRNKIFRKKNNL